MARSSIGDSAQASDKPEAIAPEAIAPEAWKALAVGAAGYVLVGFNSTATNIAFDDITASFPAV
ncbi:MAG: hypothetical protein ACI88C_002279, partial [Acidimicrobiales bacterium]